MESEYLLRRAKGEKGGKGACVGYKARQPLLVVLALVAAAAVVAYICGPASSHVARIAQLPQLSQLANFTARYFLPSVGPALQSAHQDQAYNFTGVSYRQGLTRGYLFGLTSKYEVEQRGQRRQHG